MEELVKDESRESEARTQAKLEETERAREAAKLERERKKQEALERSKARQQDPNYFQRIQESNTKPDQLSAATNEGTVYFSPISKAFFSALIHSRLID